MAIKPTQNLKKKQIYALSLSLEPKINQSRQLKSGYGWQIYALSSSLEPKIQSKRNYRKKKL